MNICIAICSNNSNRRMLLSVSPLVKWAAVITSTYSNHQNQGDNYGHNQEYEPKYATNYRSKNSPSICLPCEYTLSRNGSSSWNEDDLVCCSDDGLIDRGIAVIYNFILQYYLMHNLLVAVVCEIDKSIKTKNMLNFPILVRQTILKAHCVAAI